MCPHPNPLPEGEGVIMKIALSIIAHNEEKNIEKCLLSALRQTLKPEEIVVVYNGPINLHTKYAKLRGKY